MEASRKWFASIAIATSIEFDNGVAHTAGSSQNLIATRSPNG